MTELVIPLVDYMVMSFVAFFLLLLTGLFFYIALKLERIADRYRLKYGYDRDIESKEIPNKEDIETKLDRRERKFKRRVFKD